MIKRCKCGYLWETTWQDIFPHPHRRLRKDEGPWEDNIPEFNSERQIVRSYLYKRMRSQKISKGSKATVQFLQQEIDRVSE